MVAQGGGLGLSFQPYLGELDAEGIGIQLPFSSDTVDDPGEGGVRVLQRHRRPCLREGDLGGKRTDKVLLRGERTAVFDTLCAGILAGRTLSMILPFLSVFFDMFVRSW